MNDQQVSNMPDKEQIIALLLQGFNSTPYHQHIGLVFSYDDNKGPEAHFAKKPELLGNVTRDMIHGGLISSVFDALGGVICSIALIEKYQHYDQKHGLRKLNRLCTLSLNLNYHNPAKASALIARGNVIHQSASIFTIAMEMHEASAKDMVETGKLIASAHGSYMY